MINNSLKFGVILLSIFFIASCAGNRNIYYVGNDKFDSKEKALFEQQIRLNNLVSQIQPFEKPLVDKKLIVSIPTKDQIYSDFIFRRSKKNNSSVSSAESDSLDYGATSGYESYKCNYKMIKQKNIYKTVELVEGSYSSIIQPSPTFDTLCLFSSGEGTPVWFISNIKNGKQILSFDTTLPVGPTRTESFLNAIKAFALQ